MRGPDGVLPEPEKIEESNGNRKRKMIGSKPISVLKRLVSGAGSFSRGRLRGRPPPN